MRQPVRCAWGFGFRGLSRDIGLLLTLVWALLAKDMQASIPIIDMGPFIGGSEEQREAVAAEIFEAATTVGFTYLKNFGISPDTLEMAFAISKAFFSGDSKSKVPFQQEFNHGYGKMGGERLDAGKPADLKETFTSRDVERIPGGSEYWPSPEFEAYMRTFYGQIRGVASTVMDAFALSLGLPEGYFDPKHTGLTQTLRLLHYPPVEAVQEGQLGAGAHTDYGTLTVLFQDDAGGLQVQNVNGEWVDAPPIPGTVVINTGDLIARWSNDRFKSTPHRVVPRPAAMKNGRLSIAFFSDPDPDVMIEAIPSCVSAGSPAKYPPISAGDYIAERIRVSNM
ncbi:MAG: 2OG-Fe(II) oxygenase family protein [Verrucomicrobiota bacterium]